MQVPCDSPYMCHVVDASKRTVHTGAECPPNRLHVAQPEPSPAFSPPHRLSGGRPEHRTRSLVIASGAGRIQSVDKRPLRVRLVFLSAALALAAMLLTGCGGSDDPAKVEASLLHYLSTLDPEACLNSRVCRQGAFPVGAGPPRVRENSCKKVHTGRLRPARIPKGQVRPPRLPEGLTSWSCVVRFGKTALPVAVALKRSGEVYFAAPVTQAAPLPPATVYEGGP